MCQYLPEQVDGLDEECQPLPARRFVMDAGHCMNRPEPIIDAANPNLIYFPGGEIDEFPGVEPIQPAEESNRNESNRNESNRNLNRNLIEEVFVDDALEAVMERLTADAAQHDPLDATDYLLQDIIDRPLPPIEEPPPFPPLPLDIPSLAGVDVPMDMPLPPQVPLEAQDGTGRTRQLVFMNGFWTVRPFPVASSSTMPAAAADEELVGPRPRSSSVESAEEAPAEEEDSDERWGDWTSAGLQVEVSLPKSIPAPHVADGVKEKYEEQCTQRRELHVQRTAERPAMPAPTRDQTKPETVRQVMMLMRAETALSPQDATSLTAAIPAGTQSNQESRSLQLHGSTVRQVCEEWKRKCLYHLRGVTADTVERFLSLIPSKPKITCMVCRVVAPVRHSTGDAHITCGKCGEKATEDLREVFWYKRNDLQLLMTLVQYDVAILEYVIQTRFRCKTLVFDKDGVEWRVFHKDDCDPEELGWHATFMHVALNVCKGDDIRVPRSEGLYVFPGLQATAASSFYRIGFALPMEMRDSRRKYGTCTLGFSGDIEEAPRTNRKQKVMRRPRLKGVAITMSHTMPPHMGLGCIADLHAFNQCLVHGQFAVEQDEPTSPVVNVVDVVKDQDVKDEDVKLEDVKEEDIKEEEGLDAPSPILAQAVRTRGPPQPASQRRFPREPPPPQAVLAAPLPAQPLPPPAAPKAVPLGPGTAKPTPHPKLLHATAKVRSAAPPSSTSAART